MTDLVPDRLLFGDGPGAILVLLQETRTELGAHELDDLTVDLHLLLLGTGVFVGREKTLDFLSKEMIARVVVEGRALAAAEDVKLRRGFNHVLIIAQARGDGNASGSDLAHVDVIVV